jgi:hypothetical protein
MRIPSKVEWATPARESTKFGVALTAVLCSQSYGGTVGTWWALVTDNGKLNRNPVIQTPSDPAPGFYVSTTSLGNTTVVRKDPLRYVNAEAINLIVLPGGLNLGEKLGDFFPP